MGIRQIQHFFIDIITQKIMAEVQRFNLEHWCRKIINDPDLLPIDLYGNRLGEPDFKLPIYATYCNIFVQRVCRALGYDGFEGLAANSIYDKCKQNWFEILADEASKAAVLGDLVVAAWKNGDPEKHGHVAMVAPEEQMFFSGKWKQYCPQVYSAGKTCDLMGANYAFQEKPDYFRLNKVQS